MSHHRRIVTADAAPAAAGPYSHAVVSNGLVFCAGQIALDPESGELLGGSMGEQTRRCLENLDAVCEAAGTSLQNAVRVGVFLTDIAGDWAEVNEAYAAYFESEPPARTAIGVLALPKNARVEIDAVVALPD